MDCWMKVLITEALSGAGGLVGAGQVNLLAAGALNLNADDLFACPLESDARLA
jgi:hypothetical protein